jgi:hypothetical protein
MRRIPKILHYCFGFAQDFGGKPWSLVHYVCVKSAVERLKPEKAYIYYEHEPNGDWWEQTRSMLQPVKVKAPREIFGRPLEHVAHRADVLRLQILIRRGGIYLDSDVLVHRDFDELLYESCVLGQEGFNAEYGLANAIILAEPNAPFLKKWYEEYRWFRSRGQDMYWNEHSVRVPLALAQKHPDEVTILPHTAFYWPLWTPDHLQTMFACGRAPLKQGDFANHLWESLAWNDYLAGLTPAKVRGSDSNFHRWARPYIASLPDNFGAPTLRDFWNRPARTRIREFKKLLRQAGLRLAKFRN